MNKKLTIHNFWRGNIVIILTFAIMSIFSCILFWHSHFFAMSWDLDFHWQRINELRESMLNGDLSPLVSLNTFNQSGSAVMTMYPKINLYPVALLSLIVKSHLELLYLSFVFRNFFALIIAYFSCYLYSKNKQISILFSTSYTLSTLAMYYEVTVYGIGTSSAMAFIPLVFFGFLELLKNDNWIELSIGMSGIILSHILNTFIVGVFLIIFILLNIHDFKSVAKIYSLLKSIIATASLTSIFWIPFIIISFNNKMNLPGGLSSFGSSFSTLISTSFDNNVSESITLIAILGLITSIINYKFLSLYSKQVFWISVLILIVCSQSFPWSIVSHTFLSHIQYPSRMYVIPEVLLCYLFSENFVRMIKKARNYLGIFIIAILLILTLQVGAQEKIVNDTFSRPRLDRKLMTPFTGNFMFKLQQNSDFDNILNSTTLSNNDYFLKASLTTNNEINKRLAIYDGDKDTKVNLLGNGGFSFKLPSDSKKFSLPFMYYNGIDYQVKLDGKTVKGYPNKDALMTINNVHKGKHHVRIIVHKTKVEIASYVLSIIGLLILIGAILKNFLKKRKIE